MVSTLSAIVISVMMSSSPSAVSTTELVEYVDDNPYKALYQLQV